ncbi:MAG TPA: glycoside hydrolase family 44 protein [Bryobacteraceae bacterium]|nr:glycoside hydrolase family 44 protein [Bryobacteraceae bacterium]
MRTPFAIAAVCWAGFPAAAQLAGPALSIDAAAGRHAISPDIYGINFYWSVGSPAVPALAAAAPGIRPTARRWGGNSTSTYQWQLDVSNLDADWFYEVLPGAVPDVSKLPDGSSFNAFADQARTTGGKILGTVPILGWLPKARQEMCSFNQAKYPNQCKIDPYYMYHPMTCGDGIQYTAACGTPSVNDGKAPSSPVYIQNDPTDAYAQYDETFQAAWVRYLVSRYGKGGQGGVAIWSLDNEPIWWDSTHRDIHPSPYTYDEVLSLDTTYAAAIKQADPTALVSGPVADNWASLYFSKKDIVAGWNSRGGQYWSNPIDRNAHGGVAFMPWYLSQMQQYEKQHGTRLLDILDIHAYYEPSALDSGTESAAIDALRLDSTREFWDPSYIPPANYWIVDPDRNGAPIAPQLIPRLRQMVAQYYPGTKIAITEYNWTGQGTLNGALAQAELLGVFGREGLDMATLWGPPSPTDPVAFAFRMYRNYDGTGGAFGETGVSSTSTDLGSLSVFGALRSDLYLTAVVINKTGVDLSSTLTLANFAPGAAAQVWRYSAANLAAIVQQPDAPIGAGSLTTVFPANSITLLAIPPGAFPAPKPVVQAVTNAASYGLAIAAGQMVDIWGTGLGPAAVTGLALDSNGMVSTAVSGVRVLFDGVPAPLVYVSATQCSAVAPYFGAANPTTHVQVEYQGVRSDPLLVAVSATAPGLFTANASGTGQGSILNQDNSINSAANPATRGSVVTLWATGEGLTDPPGVDGRLAVDVLPKPVAAVSVEIGGQPAAVQYAGAAPGLMPGVLQINAQISTTAAAGVSVPVRITIGGVPSQDGVTLAVR